MIRAYGSADAAGIARFWNETFGDRRHFTAMTAARWRERIRGGRLLVAVARRRILGMIHMGEWSQGQCRRRFEDWPRGRMGIVMMLAVLPSERRRGIGARLWHAGREAVKGVAQLSIAPGIYAGTPPLWGTPFGPAVSWSDSRTRKFLGERGFGPLGKARTMELLEPGRVVPRLWVKLASVAPGLRAIVAMSRRPGKGLKPLSGEEGRLEVLTYPETDPRGHAMFERAGFVKAVDWAIYG